MAFGLDLVLFLGVLAVSAALRVDRLPGAHLFADQASHLRSAHEILNHQPLLQAPFFYTSLYLLLMAGYGLVFPSPLLGMQAWSATGGLTAALSAVALRRVAGLPAALAGAAILIFLPLELFVQVGVKSPYFLSVFVGLVLLGLAGLKERAGWGPPLVAFGATGAVAMHIGMWPMGFAGMGLAMVAALATPRRGAGGRMGLLLLTLAPSLALWPGCGPGMANACSWSCSPTCGARPRRPCGGRIRP